MWPYPYSFISLCCAILYPVQQSSVWLVKWCSNSAAIYCNVMMKSHNITFALLNAFRGIITLLLFSITALLIMRCCLNVWRGQTDGERNWQTDEKTSLLPCGMSARSSADGQLTPSNSVFNLHHCVPCLLAHPSLWCSCGALSTLQTFMAYLKCHTVRGFLSNS